MKAHEERALTKRSCYSHTNVREVHELHTTTVAVRMCLGIYTVRELRDNTVAMGLRFCLHEVVTKNRDQFAPFFLTSTVCSLLYVHLIEDAVKQFCYYGNVVLEGLGSSGGW